MSQLFFDPFVYQRSLIEAATHGGFMDGLVFGFSQRDAHNVRASEHRLGHFLEFVFEIGHIVLKLFDAIILRPAYVRRLDTDLLVAELPASASSTGSVGRAAPRRA